METKLLENTIEDSVNLEDTVNLEKQLLREMKLNELIEVSDKIFTKAKRFTKNYQNAEDLVNKTYEKAIKSLGTYTSGTNPEAWLGTIMRTTFINDCANKSNKNISYDFLINTAEESSANENMVNRSAEQEFFSNSISSPLMKAITELPENYRKPFIAYTLQGYSYREISESLGIPEGTVKSRIYRAKLTLASNSKIRALVE